MVLKSRKEGLYKGNRSKKMRELIKSLKYKTQKD